ncbi:hypothetical protein NL676_012498 [Syzygium grande]|nr:hypothetical protein NL676_012498 [Syzygium grande]
MALDLKFLVELDHQRVPLDLEMELSIGKTKPNGKFYEARSGSTSKAMDEQDDGATNEAMLYRWKAISDDSSFDKQ